MTAVTDVGETPLHYAAVSGLGGADLITVTTILNSAFGDAGLQVLLKAGASKLTENDDGDTPFDLVCQHKDADCSSVERKTMKGLLAT